MLPVVGLMGLDELPELQIDRIVSEISGILRAIGDPVPRPATTDDPDSRQRQIEAFERQLSERERFLKRYQPAIMAFIRTILADANASAVVWDSFVAKWLSGGLAKFDPSKGSFRKYLKTILRNDCRAYWRCAPRERNEIQLATEFDHEEKLHSDAGDAFDRQLRDSILRRAIQAVGEADPRFHVIVEFMTHAVSHDGKKPDIESIRHHLELVTGRDYSQANTRQLKKRAKDCLAEKLIEQTGLMIDSCVISEIEETLSELELLRFCQKTIADIRNTRGS